MQYNNESTGAISIRQICQVMTNSTLNSTLNRLNALRILFSGKTRSFCIKSNFTADLIADAANTTFSSKSCFLDCKSTRQWTYQSCNEFGFFQTTNVVDKNSFAFPEVNYSIVGKALCEKAFVGAPWGSNYSGANTSFTNEYYGNRKYRGLNVTFVNGNVDPWHSLGIVNETDGFYNSCNGNPECYQQHIRSSDNLVFMDGTAHCRDMFATNYLTVKDPPSVQWGHSKIAQNVAKYLS